MNITSIKIAVALGSIIAIFFFGWKTGASITEGKWAKADNAALKAQIALTQAAEAERDSKQKKLDRLELELARSEETALRIDRRLREEINREPIIRTIVREGDCPAVPVIDTVAHLRLWNDALARRADSAVLTGVQANSSDGGLWRSSIFARGDGELRPH